MVLRDVKVGQKVIVHIIGEGAYSGHVSSINTGKTRVQLQDVTFGEKKLSGLRKFYLSEIESVQIIFDVHETIETSKPVSGVDRKLKFRICDKQILALQRLINKRSVIKAVNDEFHEALDDIFRHECVGLYAEGVENGRQGKITWIVITTPFRIYGLSIKAIGAIPDRLKELLESDEITKVAHGVSSFSENLLHCHSINIKQVFDTMVTHKLLGLSSVDTTLQDCIMNQMELPPELIEKMICTDEISEDGIERIMNRTGILIRFHDFLTERLLKNAYDAFNENMNYCRDVDSFQMLHRNAKTAEQRMTNILPFKLNLSDES